MKKLGVCIVGVHGAVASTVIAGVHMMVKNQAPRYGMVTEKTPAAISESIADWLDFVPLENLVFGGWDLRFKNVYEGALHHKVTRTLTSTFGEGHRRILPSAVVSWNRSDTVPVASTPART